MLAAFCAPDGVPARWINASQTWFRAHGAKLEAFRAPSAHGWLDKRRSSAAGGTLLHGWIDNSEELAKTLGIAGSDPALVYNEAVARWGREADQHIHGHYAAITALPDGKLRLARSPWTAPPLSYARQQEGLIAGSLPGLFSAIGIALDPDYTVLADQLATDAASAHSLYKAIIRVKIGSIVELGEDSIEVIDWYDVSAFSGASGDDLTTATNKCAAFLGEACRSALRQAGRPAVALSGGLDSPIVASELMKQSPGKRLTGITFVPDPAWEGADFAGTVGNEWPIVERYAALHPQLDSVRGDPAHGGLDHRYREIAQIAGVFNPSQSLLGPHHAVWQAAQERRHDWLFTADLGNQTFSADGRWAYAECAKAGDFRGLLDHVRARANDPRPLWRKTLALGILPHFPRPIRAVFQRALKGGADRVIRRGNMLSRQARSEYRDRARARRSSPAWEGLSYARDRADAARQDWDNQRADLAEITLAMELRYGVQYRDITAYRPLIEYCLSLPTAHFIAPGRTRILAKRLAVGRMPIEQYEEAPHGLHHVDWLVRLKRDAPRLRQQVSAMRDHPWLAETIDLDRVDQMLAGLPTETGENSHDALAYLNGVGQVIVAGQFISMLEGRNDF